MYSDIQSRICELILEVLEEDLERFIEGLKALRRFHRSDASPGQSLRQMDGDHVPRGERDRRLQPLGAPGKLLIRLKCVISS